MNGDGELRQIKTDWQGGKQKWDIGIQIITKTVISPVNVFKE